MDSECIYLISLHKGQLEIHISALGSYQDIQRRLPFTKAQCALVHCHFNARINVHDVHDGLWNMSVIRKLLGVRKLHGKEDMLDAIQRESASSHVAPQTPRPWNLNR